MTRHIKRLFWLVVALLLVCVGLIGIFLPFLHGVLFLCIGLFILSVLSPSFRIRLHLARDRFFPRFKDRIAAFEEKLEKKIGHWFRE
jgi:uncharacterized membrane protein YbaN (DUF454 family)